jgi:hypothetical protein
MDRSALVDLLWTLSNNSNGTVQGGPVGEISP